jgi:hypothetical protein
MNTVAELVFLLVHWRDACTPGEYEARPDLFLASLTAACVYNCWFFVWNRTGLHGKNLLPRRFNPGRRDATNVGSPAAFRHLLCHLILVLVSVA